MAWREANMVLDLPEDAHVDQLLQLERQAIDHRRRRNAINSTRVRMAQRKRMASLQAGINKYEHENAELERRLAELERRLAELREEIEMLRMLHDPASPPVS